MTTTAVPQHIQALERGNAIRLARAERKRQIARGDLTVAAVVEEVPAECESMTLAELLGAQHRWGSNRTRRLLTRVGLREHKTLGSLTARQRGLLVLALSPEAQSTAA